LELQHRLIRQAINIAVSKALDDMRGNTRRSLRNLIELGLLFSRSENQRGFFGLVQRAVSEGNNRYYRLASRVIQDVNPDTLKTVGINLGYSSLVNGAHQLQKKQIAENCALPWMVIFDARRCGCVSFELLGRLISEGRKIGICTYVFRAGKQEEMLPFCSMAAGFEECMFFLEAPLGFLQSPETAECLGGFPNLAVAVDMACGDFGREDAQNAFSLLRKNRCLYGYRIDYGEEERAEAISRRLVSEAIGLGNVFGVYVPKIGVSAAARNEVFSEICSKRKEKGQPLILLDWVGDMRFIGEKIRSGMGYFVLDSLTAPKDGEMAPGLLELLKRKARGNIRLSPAAR